MEPPCARGYPALAMLATRLIELIGAHAEELTRAALADLARDPRTLSFRRVSADELEARVFATYHNLVDWISHRSDHKVGEQYEPWGAVRFHQGIPLGEIVHALRLVKRQIDQLIRNDSMQELDDTVDEFFDRASHHLARGHETEAGRRASLQSI